MKLDLEANIGVHRELDITVGHECWPPTIPATWSRNVRVNRRGVVRYGDRIVEHRCEDSNHDDYNEVHGGVYVDQRRIRVNKRYVQVCTSIIQCDNGDIDHAGTCARGGRLGS